MITDHVLIVSVDDQETVLQVMKKKKQVMPSPIPRAVVEQERMSEKIYVESNSEKNRISHVR